MILTPSKCAALSLSDALIDEVFNGDSTPGTVTGDFVPKFSNRGGLATPATPEGRKPDMMSYVYTCPLAFLS